MAVEFATIASGSSGNCVYIGTENTKILIDAGLSGKKVQDGLKTLNLTGSDIDAIFVTHEHIDHVQGVGILSRRFDIPIYATDGTWNGMPSTVGEIKERNKRFVYCDEKCVINDICIQPFEIPHDANEPVGYTINTERFKVCVATDLGHVTQKIIDNTKDSDVLLLESNHDIDMLKRGTYPYPLKQRILGKKGHLSNETAGKLLSHLVKNSKRLEHIFLGHLSKENNTPSLALDTVNSILKNDDIKIGEDINLYMAKRYGVENLVKLV